MPSLPDEAAWPARWQLLYAQALSYGAHDTGRRSAEELVQRPVRLISDALRRL